MSGRIAGAGRRTTAVRRVKPRVPTEAQEARAFTKWRTLAMRVHPELRWMYAVPNGGRRDGKTAALMVAEGAVAGVADYCLPVACGLFHGLYVELKRQDGGERTAEQVAFIEFVRANGYRADFASGWEAVRVIVLDYLALGPFDWLGRAAR